MQTDRTNVMTKLQNKLRCIGYIHKYGTQQTFISNEATKQCNESKIWNKKVWWE